VDLLNNYLRIRILFVVVFLSAACLLSHLSTVDIIRLVSVKIAPRPQTARQLLHDRLEKPSSRPLSTMLPLDEYLRGGLQPGSLTEVRSARLVFCCSLS
jgi:hypothetical protein